MEYNENNYQHDNLLVLYNTDNIDHNDYNYFKFMNGHKFNDPKEAIDNLSGDLKFTASSINFTQKQQDALDVIEFPTDRLNSFGNLRTFHQEFFGNVQEFQQNLAHHMKIICNGEFSNEIDEISKLITETCDKQLTAISENKLSVEIRFDTSDTPRARTSSNDADWHKDRLVNNVDGIRFFYDDSEFSATEKSYFTAITFKGAATRLQVDGDANEDQTDFSVNVGDLVNINFGNKFGQTHSAPNLKDGGSRIFVRMSGIDESSNIKVQGVFEDNFNFAMCNQPFSEAIKSSLKSLIATTVKTCQGCDLSYSKPTEFETLLVNDRQDFKFSNSKVINFYDYENLEKYTFFANDMLTETAIDNDLNVNEMIKWNKKQIIEELQNIGQEIVDIKNIKIQPQSQNLQIDDSKHTNQGRLTRGDHSEVSDQLSNFMKYDIIGNFKAQMLNENEKLQTHIDAFVIVTKIEAFDSGEKLMDSHRSYLQRDKKDSYEYFDIQKQFVEIAKEGGESVDIQQLLK